MAQYCVYCHLNKLNGKRYIGLTKSSPPSKRWGANGINYKACHCFYAAIQKYGWNNFEHIILETNLTEEQAVNKERYYIKLYNTIIPNGYNLTYGGEIKKEISDETRERLRISHLGQTWSEEQRRQASISRMGHVGYNRKAVWMCDKLTHKKLRKFTSMTEASKFLNNEHAYSHIGKVCNGERNSAYGYFWEYASDGGEDLLHN